MERFFRKRKIISRIQKMCFLIFQIITLSFLLLLPSHSSIYSSALPSTGVHVDGYQELEEPFYPFQQYIQVRKTYTMEHVPVYDQSSSNLDTSASTSSAKNSDGDHHQASSSSHDDGGSGGDGGSHYHVPRLREEVHDYKKHEVYEEKGYGDSDYDHHQYGYRNNDKPSYNDHHHGASNVQDTSTSSSGKRYYKPSRSLHSPDGSSSKILEYAASNLYDHDAHQKGIYAARENIYCPEVIDFDLSSKSMRMGQGWRGGAKPRLRGLGSKIKCLKERYFGREPLPKAIFDDPSESRHSEIKVPTFKSFFDMVKHGVESSSSFQNSRVPAYLK